MRVDASAALAAAVVASAEPSAAATASSCPPSSPFWLRHRETRANTQCARWSDPACFVSEDSLRSV
jgi:hypothetical protein